MAVSIPLALLYMVLLVAQPKLLIVALRTQFSAKSSRLS
jgi:hypothetical protein